MQIKRNTNIPQSFGNEMASQVIEMHRLGYELDFYETGHGLACLQSGLCFPWNQLILERLQAEGDFLARGAAQIYTVETQDGHRGLLLTRKVAYLSKKAS